MERKLRLVVVTAMIDTERTAALWATWRERATIDWDGFVVVNGGEVSYDSAPWLLQLIGRGGACFRRREVLGVVPAFIAALTACLDGIPLEDWGDTVVALLHDDVAIEEDAWDRRVLEAFQDPKVGLVGFGGALGVGRPGMYDEPFDPMTLARHDFISNMRHAETHGRRVTTTTRVAVLDGFSMIGLAPIICKALGVLRQRNVIHHAYDVAVGCSARRGGWKTLMLPIACHHHGGMSAVANPRYAAWAEEKFGGDNQVWLHAHRQVWEEYMDVLPFRVEA